MPPTNTTFYTAADIPSLPVGIVLDVSELSPVCEVWYKYTAQPGDTNIGFAVAAVAGTGYYPTITMYD